MRRQSAAKFRTADEIDELVALARQYCETRAGLRCASAEGRLSPQQELSSAQQLQLLDRKIELLKSGNELDRQRARRERRVITLAQYPRMAR